MLPANSHFLARASRHTRFCKSSAVLGAHWPPPRNRQSKKDRWSAGETRSPADDNFESSLLCWEGMEFDVRGTRYPSKYPSFLSGSGANRPTARAAAIYGNQRTIFGPRVFVRPIGNRCQTRVANSNFGFTGEKLGTVARRTRYTW